jgi:hypothetical protein
MFFSGSQKIDEVCNVGHVATLATSQTPPDSYQTQKNDEVCNVGHVATLATSQTPPDSYQTQKNDEVCNAPQVTPSRHLLAIPGLACGKGRTVRSAC